MRKALCFDVSKESRTKKGFVTEYRQNTGRGQNVFDYFFRSEYDLKASKIFKNPFRTFIKFIC